MVGTSPIGGIIDDEQSIHVLCIVVIGAPAVSGSWNVFQGKGNTGWVAVDLVKVSVAAVAGAGVHTYPICNEIKLGAGPVRIISSTTVNHLLNPAFAGIRVIYSESNTCSEGCVISRIDKVTRRFVCRIVRAVARLRVRPSILRGRIEINPKVGEYGGAKSDQ